MHTLACTCTYTTCTHICYLHKRTRAHTYACTHTHARTHALTHTHTHPHTHTVSNANRYTCMQYIHLSSTDTEMLNPKAKLHTGLTSGRIGGYLWPTREIAEPAPATTGQSPPDSTIQSYARTQQEFNHSCICHSGHQSAVKQLCDTMTKQIRSRAFYGCKSISHRRGAVSLCEVAGLGQRLIIIIIIKQFLYARYITSMPQIIF